MMLLRSFIAIYNTLDEVELKLLNSSIKMNVDKQSPSKLFIDYISKNDLLNESSISKYIYGKENLVALKKLIQRLTEKLLEILISKESIANNDIYDTKIKEVFYVRKKLLYFDVLNLRGIDKYANAI